jgi:hypothetical protein
MATAHRTLPTMISRRFQATLIRGFIFIFPYAVAFARARTGGLIVGNSGGRVKPPYRATRRGKGAVLAAVPTGAQKTLEKIEAFGNKGNPNSNRLTALAVFDNAA